ncbi:hypothetical protein [Streptomyces flavidovirens]|uniref:hypothetical protein n=1 Tax=Streptomyces flavidovirens TaxID=67298 RepID=UPI0036AF1A32
MGIHQWGKSVTGLVLAAAVTVGASGCGGDAAAQKQLEKSKTVSVTEATTAFQDAVAEFDSTNGCPKAVGECWDKMTAVMEPARELRKAMNADEGAGPEFWSEAYALIDTMEDGMAVGEDRFTNRPKVLGSAHSLGDWLDEHPVE